LCLRAQRRQQRENENPADRTQYDNLGNCARLILRNSFAASAYLEPSRPTCWR
jgi:hypothetical protein